MGYFNLDDNMIVQVVAFVLTLGCWVIWILITLFADPATQPAAHIINGTANQGTWAIPMINDAAGFGSQAGVLGTILFNFGFVTTVPSWVNEKKPEVSVNKTVWMSTALCLVIFYVIGIPGAAAFKYYLAGPATNNCAYGIDTGDPGNCVQDLMELILGNDANGTALAPSAWADHPGSRRLMHLSVYLFPIVAILSSIPVFSIVIKYNCIENGFSKRFATLWGVIFPWVAAAPLLYQPGALATIINFSSLFFVSFTDFIVPWCLYIVMNQKEFKEHIKKLDPGIYEDAGIQEKEALVADDSEALLAANTDITEHFALPPSWNWNYKTKIYISGVLVIAMTGLSLGGTVLTIQQAGQLNWSCPSVSF